MRLSEYEADGERTPQRARSERPEETGLTQAALAAGAPPAVQRAAMLDLQRAAGNASAAGLLEEDEASAGVRGVVGSGSGQPLDRDTRSMMESRLGADFSDVRVHTGGTASESARQMNAQAYTVGNDVVFQSGNYAPETDSGKHMLAHELTHVVQQRSGPVSGTPMAGGVKVSHPSDPFEQAAERSADAAMAAPSAASAAPVQRQEEGEEEELQRLPVQREATEEEAEEEELTEG
ncbi:MAG: DUF4157 domain-containing protein [Nitriliruptorales bacterium]|nr:DUF4157 domain-containing protein [Nitriliruptorales bacterium]